MAGFLNGIGKGPNKRRFAQNFAFGGASTNALSPSEGVLTLAGQVASITLIIAAVTGALTISGNAPSITTILAPSEGVLTISGNAPSISTQFVPSAGQLTIAGNAPSISVAAMISPTEGIITIAGQAPLLTTIFNPSSGTLTISGQQPSLTSIFNPSEGALVISGNVPDLIIPTSLPAVEPPKITGAGGGGQRIHRNNDFIIHKHEPKPYIYPYKRNMENQDRQDITDLLAMLEDSGLLD